MNRCVAVLILFCVFIGFALAQPRGFGGKLTATGTILDSKTSEPLFAATVKATSSDGGSGSFAITDENGKFSLELPNPGKYTLEFSYMGYKPLSKEVTVWPGRAALGKFKLTEDARMLREVESVGHSERIKQSGDTLAYNADAYKVQDGASAEELVSKMPGIEVTGEGVKAQGETVQKVLVDGKEFFDNDVKMALRSLPAEVLQSVNVFDKKSDQAEFTGIDDGQTVKAMDLVTKSYRRNGVFGKVFGGLGSNFDFDNGYWNTGFNINVFNGDRRMTFQGMSNNVNERNFSNDDFAAGGGRSMGRSWGGSGVARTNGFGVNFTDAYLGGKLNVEMSYFFNQTRTVSGDTTYMDDLNREYSSYTASRGVTHNMSHRIGGRITYKPSERDEIMIRPSINFQNSDGESFYEGRSWMHNLDSVSINRQPQQYWDDVLSRSNNVSTTESDSWNINAVALWRHRLNKPGRTLSIFLNGGLSGSDSDNRYNKEQLLGGNLLYENQKYTNDNENHNLSGNIQWTEPLATGLNLSLRYDANFSESSRESMVRFFDDPAFVGKDSIDQKNSNTYTQKNFKNSGEVGLSYNLGTFRANATVRFEDSQLDGEQEYRNGYKYSTSKNYFSVLPTLRLEYRTEGGTQFRVDYRARSSAPSVNNLQESVNTTNRLSYSTGNPDLDQTVGHNANFNMIYTNTETAQNFMIFGGFNATQRQISNLTLTNNSKENMAFADLTAAERNLLGINNKNKDVMDALELAPGARFTRPVNRKGSVSGYLNVGYGFPFDAIMSNVNISVGGNYGVNPSYKLFYEYNQDKKAYGITEFESKTRSMGLNPRLHISSNISSDLNFNLMYAPSFQWVDDKSGTVQDRDYINHNLNASLNWTFWRGFTTDQVLNYSRFGGPAQPEAIEQWIWNASIGRKFLKGNKAEIKLQAYDILGSNKGYNRTVGDSDIRYTYQNFMPRYFLVTFTYKLSAYKAGGKQATQNSDNGGFGGPGGFGGRGGFGGGGPRF